MKRYRDKVRKDWDRKIGDLEKLVSMLEARGLQFLPPASTVRELLREFNFFDTSNRVSSNKTYDIHRLGKMCQLIPNSMMSSVENQNILVLSQKNSGFWKVQARNFILRLLPALLYLSDNTTESSTDLDIILNVLSYMFDSKKWPTSVADRHILVDEILRSCVTWGRLPRRTEWTLFKIIREFLNRKTRNHRIEIAFVSLCRKLLLENDNEHLPSIASAFSNTILTARYTMRPLHSPFRQMLTSELFNTETWSLCLQNMLISTDLDTIIGQLHTLTGMLDFSVRHHLKRSRGRLMRTNKDVRYVVSILSKLVPLVPVSWYRKSASIVEEKMDVVDDEDEDDDDDDERDLQKRNLDTELPSLESREIPETWGKRDDTTNPTSSKDIQDAINILLDRTLVSRLCSCFEPENDRDEVYPVDFVSQLYVLLTYRRHTRALR